MKNWKVLGFAAAAFLSAGFTFKGSSIHEVNKKIAGLLQAYNDDKTQAELQFTDLNIDATKTLDFGARFLFSKIGSKNKLVAQIEKVEYHYGDGSHPQLDLAGRVELDLVKAIGQQAINEMASGIADIAVDFTKDFTEKYGEAVVIDASVDELLKDEKGDIKSVKVHFDAALDFNKLPPTLPKAEVEFQTLRLNVAATRKGLGFQARLVLNPQHKSFGQDGVGFKEYIEGLLSGNEDTYRQIGSIAQTVNSIAQRIVEYEHSEK